MDMMKNNDNPNLCFCGGNIVKPKKIYINVGSVTKNLCECDKCGTLYGERAK